MSSTEHGTRLQLPDPGGCWADFGPARPTRLARALGIEASAVNRFADRMVDAG